MNINEVINRPEYNFIKTDGRLGKNIIFLSFGGSHAYGTNIESSDIDLRGCAVNSKTDLLGLSNFEQFETHETDTVIYAFNKLINLLANCNPNVIEMLGCKPEHYVMMLDIGEQLIAERRMFLSQKVFNSFGGYANQQLRRLQNILAKSDNTQLAQEQHILNTCKHVLENFDNEFANFNEGSVKLHIQNSMQDDLEAEIFMDINLSKYPLRDYSIMMEKLHKILKAYKNLNKRNNKKDDLKLNKHAMHLVRLYLMCIDILEKEEIITYREKDHDLLMAIRNGAFLKDDHTYRSDFFDIVDELERKMMYAKENSSLPKSPNYSRIQEFMMHVNERVVRNDY